ncbi:3-deoxy-manno-octulosonate cytidylyltransferase [Alloprevotella rava F0323]|uniref:3-deoxy-manno-octulosonate cytidylyltransferase n=1 Tax=Alloprevotella rava F0323 TaxID=679199 RepID=G5G9V2_9BACT|nr:3-deoxy-manno-octulosonate cytidylyltransferase [Alloprevotella rava]EHG24152.1 3-deoxy-manno-octulosonate cytidylyltransferase [Alloprevotella rava F0323]
MKFLALIPARYASTRFPAKPLARLGGKYIIQRVYEGVSKVFSDAYVATDDKRIYDVVLSFGGNAVMTSTEHKSGTDRCFEALQKLEAKGNKYDVVVNIQGDEPFIAASQLESIKDCFDNSLTQIATLVKPFASDAPLSELLNPNSPKVVLSNEGNALYFSRSVIPYLRNVPQEEWLQHHTFYKHIGLYAYRADILATITSLPQGNLEQCESLEQLRWLEAGLAIKVKETNIETIGIDTPEDLQLAEDFLSNNQ